MVLGMAPLQPASSHNVTRYLLMRDQNPALVRTGVRTLRTARTGPSTPGFIYSVPGWSRLHNLNGITDIGPIGVVDGERVGPAAAVTPFISCVLPGDRLPVTDDFLGVIN